MRARQRSRRGVLLLALLSQAAGAASFLEPGVPISEQGARTSRAGNHVDVVFEPGEYPNAAWAAPSGLWDWTATGGLLLDAENLGDAPAVLHLRIDNPGADGTKGCNRATLHLPPHTRRELRTRLHTSAQVTLWGMRGVPGVPPVAEGPPLDPARITGFQIFLHRPPAPHAVRLHRLELLPPAPAMPLPFVDRFGQYLHAEWPGKVAREDELPARNSSEALPEAGLIGPGDRYGGWAEGPRLEATGWFRTAQHGGRWWLVTPEGALFFSLGVNCVGTWERTFIEGREAWFEWLPTAQDPVFGELLGHADGAHRLAGAPGGKGRTFSFYCANLTRKYGASWRDQWRRRAFQRLRGWSFNTVGNWAEAEVLRESPLPYVASCAIEGAPVIEAAAGYWAKMHDVYAPGFAAAVETQVTVMTRPHRDRPLCLGYFVDNELAWEGVIEGVLRSPPSQPARAALHRHLLARYADLAALNAAWGTHYPALEAITPDHAPGEARRRDLDDFLLEFARTYFGTVAAAIHAHDPHHLYLGCRFASAPPAVVRAAAEFADVVSFNLYRDSVDCLPFAGIGKPVVIGEFHFGATDRGLFHPGISATRTQDERAAAYTAYIESAAACPAVVGAHWFQFVDEPLTGRWFDGENYNIGLVDVTDTPYPELVSAATQTNARIYALRAGELEAGNNGESVSGQ